MDFEVGSRVVYNGEEYKVVWIYGNENVEIAKNGPQSKVELVPKSELTKID